MFRNSGNIKLNFRTEYRRKKNYPRFIRDKVLFSVKYSKKSLDDEYRIKIENEMFDDFVIERLSSFISSEIGTRKIFFPFFLFPSFLLSFLSLKFQISTAGFFFFLTRERK